MKLFGVNIDKRSARMVLLTLLLILGGYLSMKRGDSKNIMEIRQYYMDYMRETN